TSAWANDRVSVDNFTYQSEIAKLVLKLDNSNGRAIERMTVSCAFLDKGGRAVDVVLAMFRDINRGEIAYDTAAAVLPERPDSVACRVKRLREK
ncbi:MAG: hypothetical protein AAF737_04920, partial [Pseudomonadota bacterium]